MPSFQASRTTSPIGQQAGETFLWIGWFMAGPSPNAALAGVDGARGRRGRGSPRQHRRKEAAGEELVVAYDLNGNTASTVNTTTGIATTYKWDAQDRLVAVERSDVVTSFTYDAFGRCIGIEQGPSTGGVLSSHELTYEEFSLAMERETIGGSETFYFGQGQLTDGTGYLHLRDHLGSVRNVVNSATDAVANSYAYDAWGSESIASESVFCRPRYAGLLASGVTGGFYMAIYRMYDAEMGRWVNRDPIGEAGGIGLYSYVLNSPLSLSDPTGLHPLLALILIALLVLPAYGALYGLITGFFLCGVFKKVYARCGISWNKCVCMAVFMGMFGLPVTAILIALPIGWTLFSSVPLGMTVGILPDLMC